MFHGAISVHGEGDASVGCIRARMRTESFINVTGILRRTLDAVFGQCDTMALAIVKALSGRPWDVWTAFATNPVGSNV